MLQGHGVTENKLSAALTVASLGAQLTETIVDPT